jgi:hypothetical protein
MSHAGQHNETDWTPSEARLACDLLRPTRVREGLARESPPRRVASTRSILGSR